MAGIDTRRDDDMGRKVTKVVGTLNVTGSLFLFLETLYLLKKFLKVAGKIMQEQK